MADRPEPLLRNVLGAVLRRRRRIRGYTLEELARISGISPQYISEVERGRKEPSSEVLSALTGALELTLTGLLDDARELTVHDLTDRNRARRPVPPAVVPIASGGAASGAGRGALGSRTGRGDVLLRAA